jgi:hypothetical protein
MVCAIVLVSLITYLPLLNGYFIQDEWQLFSTYYSFSGKSFINVIISFLNPQPGQFVPITQIVSYSIFYFFKINYFAYFIFGLFLHILAGILLWRLLLKLTKNGVLSFLGSVFFLITPSHFQATSWVVANIGYGISAVLFLLGLTTFFMWIKNDKFRLSLISATTFFLSLLAKEITIFIFVALPIIAYIWTTRIKKVIQSLVIVLPVFLFAVWNYLYIRANPMQDLTVQKQVSLENIIFLPLKEIAESIIPQGLIYQIAKFFVFLLPPYNFEKVKTTSFNLLAETDGAKVVVILVAVIFMIIGIYIYKWSTAHKDLQYFKLYMTGLFLVALSGVPYIFVDTPKFTLLQPRYTYIGVLSVAFSLVAIYYVVLQKWGKRVTVTAVIILLLLSYAAYNMSSDLAKEGELRKTLLLNISSIVPHSQNTIIYTESDQSFYGVKSEVHILPFQNGAGKALAVYLHDNIYIPQEIYRQDILWSIESQGYYRDENGSFGYFRDFNELAKIVSSNSIDLNSIVAFRFDSKNEVLTDISEQIRTRLRELPEQQP